MVIPKLGQACKKKERGCGNSFAYTREKHYLIQKFITSLLFIACIQLLTYKIENRMSETKKEVFPFSLTIVNKYFANELFWAFVEEKLI